MRNRGEFLPRMQEPNVLPVLLELADPWWNQRQEPQRRGQSCHAYLLRRPDQNYGMLACLMADQVVNPNDRVKTWEPLPAEEARQLRRDGLPRPARRAAEPGC
jgi:hypothetical protein